MDVGSIPELPTGAPELLREQGVEELYPPQAEAVEAGVTAGEHLVASVPTASGKTMIAQLAMLSAIDRGGTALYIVPLRALASEKAEEFEALEALGVDVGVSTGNYEASGEWLGGKDLIVATSEKVDSLVRNGASWIEDLGCVVADEVHLIDDAQRGPTLEVTLAKLRQLNPGAQLVALSATVDNADEIAAWLDAELVDSDWRPIELRAGVHYGGAAHFDDGEQEELSVGASESATAGIVRDTLEEEGSTLVFVNSRRNAEAAARRLAGVVEPRLTPDERVELAELAAEVRDVSDTETSDDLAEAVERGAAFHHAGLANEHRSIVEDAFRDRLVKVVSATPTLAAGVNTPSRRVVVRDWRRYDGTAGGMQPLPVLEVHQMMGRAGRPGRDPYGEALLLAKSHDELEELQERYVEADPEPVRSKLAAEPALRTHVLATVASGFARSRSGLLEFLGETLYASQTAEDGRIERVVDDVLEYLRRNGFLEQDGDALSATSLGHTVSRLYLDPMSAATIVDGLESAVGAPGRGRNAAANDGATATGSGAAANGGATTDQSANASDGETAESAAGETADDPSPAEGDPEDAAGFQRASELGASDASGGDAMADEADSVAGEDGVAAGDSDAATDEDDAAIDASDAAADRADATATAESDDESPPTEASADVEVTPLGLYHLVSRTPDMYELYLRSGDQETYSELFYERERELLGPAPTEYEEDRFEDWLAALKTAKLLEDWAEELEEEALTERYEVGPGDIRSKVDTAEWLLGAAEEVAAELDLPVVDDVRRARMRVQHGVREDLLDLVGVRGVGRKRARRLHAAGIADREALRTADKGPILGALRGREATAERVLENAGREDPSMEGIVPTDPVDAGEPLEGTGGGRGTRAGTTSGQAGSAGSEDTDDDQSNLGDFS